MNANLSHAELQSRIAQLEEDLAEAEAAVAEAAVLLAPLADDDPDIRTWLSHLPLGHVLTRPV